MNNNEARVSEILVQVCIQEVTGKSLYELKREKNDLAPLIDAWFKEINDEPDSIYVQKILNEDYFSIEWI